MAEAATAEGIIIEYMDESSNGTYSELHTQATTVGTLKSEKGLSNGAVVSVDNVISNDSTALTPGCSVTVVSGNKTGGTRRQNTVTNTIPGGRGFDATLSNNGTLKKSRTKTTTDTLDSHGTVLHNLTTSFRGKKLVYELREGVDMPPKDMVIRRSAKYPFHLLQVGQSVSVPITERVPARQATRHFMEVHPYIHLESRTMYLDDDIRKPVLNIWRTI